MHARNIASEDALLQQFEWTRRARVSDQAAREVLLPEIDYGKRAIAGLRGGKDLLEREARCS